MEKPDVILSIISIAIAVSLSNSPLYGQQVMETLEDRGKTQYVVQIPEEKERVKPAPYLTAERLQYNVSGGVNQGYDNNVFLDSSRKDDSFTESNVSMNFKYPFLDEKLKLKYGFDITDIAYYNITDASVLDGAASTGFDFRFLDRFIASPGYRFNIVWYPNDDQGSYVWNELNISLKQDLVDKFFFLDKLYHRGAYRLSFQNFLERKYRLGNANLSSKVRADSRHTFEHELGLYIFDSLVKVTNQFYINESNDQYQDYYDYNSYRLGGSLIHIFTEKFYSIASFYWQKKYYDDRLSSQDSSHEKDDVYMVNTSIFYDVTPQFSLSVNYSYRESQSNEPLQKYSGSVFTLGASYNF